MTHLFIFMCMTHLFIFMCMTHLFYLYHVYDTFIYIHVYDTFIYIHVYDTHFTLQNNLEVEHKFSRTVLWVDYIGDENTRPIPFNLIPSLKSMRSWCGRNAPMFKKQNSRMQRVIIVYIFICILFLYTNIYMYSFLVY